MAKLVRRIIGDALKAQLGGSGWKIRARVTGSIRAHPPAGTDVATAREEIERRVRELGYVPNVTSDHKANGDVCITFNTPETVAQAGQGSQRAPSGAAEKKIVAWHEKILTEALAWRAQHPGFTFNLRTGDITGQDRLAKGFWFTGSNYLFFAPFRPNDPNNHTRTIGFVIAFNRNGDPRRSYLEVVFGSVNPASIRPLHQRIIEMLGGFHQAGSAKYQRNYESQDPITAFRQFLETDLPQLTQIISEAGATPDFIIPEDDFERMFARVNQVRAQGGTPVPAPKPQTISSGPVNLILYGPPGTGKTHWLRTKQDEYTDRPETVDRETWLQGALAQVGWREVIASALADMGGKSHVPGLRDHEWVRAKAVQRGRNPKLVTQTIWGNLQAHTHPDIKTVLYERRREPFIFEKNIESEWSLVSGWSEVDEESANLFDQLKAGPGQMSRPITRYRTVTFHASYTYEDFIRGIRPVLSEDEETSQFRIVDGVFKKICDEARGNPSKRYAIFIDEINRANIAKVFGELITLVEVDKRAAYDAEGRLTGGLTVQLPGGDPDADEDPFGVPANLDIYGTMNTADRSIALLDIALRRRFQFVEMLPDYSLLQGEVAEINLGHLLLALNNRLEFLLDREHRIGHAYLMGIRTIEELRDAFAFKIIPLLQEYFFEDFERVALVLRTGDSVPPFVTSTTLQREVLFPEVASSAVAMEDRKQYQVTPSETWTPASFRALYSATKTL